MAYTATQLITGAYYAAGIVSREFETVSGSQSSDGLLWLNNILAEKRVDQSMSPYETQYNFIAQIGVEKYFIPKLSQVDTIVFYLDKVRYGLTYTKRNQYFGSSRVENINSLPFEWYFERQTGGGNLYIYFKPDRQYPIEIHGSFDMEPITNLQQDLTSNVTIADLGVPTLYGDGSLAPGQLVINGEDFNGSNGGSLANLVNNINEAFPNIKATIEINNFVLTSTTQPPSPIYVQTNGFSLPDGIGTKFIGNVVASNANNLIFSSATYYPGVSGNLGPGATLTALAPGVLVVDGYTVGLNERVLLTSDLYNTFGGSYQLTTVGDAFTPWVLTRTTNYDQPIKINPGDLFTVLNGVVNKGKTFVQTARPFTVGYSTIAFSEFNAITFSNFSTIETPLYEVFNATGFDQFYLTYLRYALADRICAEYNYDTPANVMRQLSKYEAWINKKSKLIDLTMQKNSTLHKRSTFNWAFINLGKGWRPS